MAAENTVSMENPLTCPGVVRVIVWCSSLSSFGKHVRFKCSFGGRPRSKRRSRLFFCIEQ